MKITTTTLIAMLIYVSLFAQIGARTDFTIAAPNSNLKSTNPTAPSPGLLTKVVIGNGECLSQADQKIIQDQIDRNVEMLRLTNPDLVKKSSGVHPMFIWPTQPKAGFTDYGYYTNNFLVDNNLLNSGNLLDYNCGNRTYDWGSGNHQGTDIILWPYAWRRMDEQVMEVVAAAPGVIVNKVDGNYDRNCANNGSGAWNAIHIQHSDGSVAWYLHFKSGSLTTKNVGAQVLAGEYLGTAGSSGSSDWPHLHFQVMDSNGDLVDPWDGNCNIFNAGDGWWQNQQTYTVPSVNRICTKTTTLDFYDCPDPEITFEKDTFNIGDSLCLWIYTRDMELNSTFQINLYNPSNVNAINWSFTVPWATLATSYLRWFYVVDNWWVPGWWKFEIVYAGNTYYHMYYMTGTGVGLNESGSHLNNLIIAPNPGKEQVLISGINFVPGDEISVTDAIGNICLTEKVVHPSASISIPVTNFRNGVYFIQAKTSQRKFVQKLVVQH